MSELIRAKVARVLNSREIAINAGKKHGVSVGMLFDVMDPKGEDIKDPATSEVLGSLLRPKIRVKVTRVQDKLSVASTYKKKRINVGGVQTFGVDIGAFSRSLMPPKYEERFETLKTDEKTWEDIEEDESFVKTGDPVVQVVEDLKPDIK